MQAGLGTAPAGEWRLKIIELLPHRRDDSAPGGPEMIMSTQKPFTLRVALIDDKGDLVELDQRIPLKAQLLYENGRVVEPLNEPTLLGCDALLEHGLATFDKLQVRVLSSQRQLQRFRVHLSTRGPLSGISVISEPLRTLTKIRPRPTRTLEDMAADQENRCESKGTPTTPSDQAVAQEAVHSKALWNVVDEHGRQLKMLKAQHDEILSCLRDLSAASQQPPARQPSRERRREFCQA